MTDQTTASPMTVTWPAHDPATYRVVPASSSAPLDPTRVASLLAAEWERFEAQTPGSGAHHARALGLAAARRPVVLPALGPVPRRDHERARARGSPTSTAAQVLDLSMGFGAMLAGHLNPTVIAAVGKALETGTLFVTPSPSATDAAERFQRRFGLDQLRFANSGTEATMYALRTARAFTGRKAIIKIEGGYHGGYDALQVSVKPAVAEAGPEEAPTPVTPFEVEAGTVHVVPYNDLARLEQLFAEHGSEVACVFMEPVLENIGIVVPDEGYLAGGARACATRNGALLVFDEVKTGLTAGYAGRLAAPRRHARPRGARQEHRRRPAARGVRRHAPRSWPCVTDGRMPHFGTYNGNPLVMAAAVAIDEIATRGGARRRREAQRRRARGDERDHRRARAARPHRRLRRQGRGHLVAHAGPQLPRLQAHRLRRRPSSRGCGASTAASSPRPGSTSSGSSRSRTPRDDMGLLVDEFRELAEALRA